MSKTILITGAAGFIGFHLAKALHARGDKVIGYDNFNDYYDPTLKQRRAQELGKWAIPVHVGDICNQDLLLKTLRAQGITHLVHLAAQPGVRYSLVNPHAYVKANIEGFVSILEACRQLQLPLTYASSSSVYGANATIPFSVGDRTDKPVSLYGATKKSNELMAYTYHHLFGIPMTGLRFFTVYGPWGRPDMAYFSFAEAIRLGKPIELYHPPQEMGSMRRDFTYIDDIVAGTMAAIDLASPYAIYNLGHHRPEEVTELVALLERYLGKDANLILRPMPPGDVPATYADIEVSRQQLGFEPKISLQEGIKRFVNWYLDEFVEKNSPSA